MHSSAPPCADGKEKGRPGGERRSERSLGGRKKKKPECQKETEKEDKREKCERRSHNTENMGVRGAYIIFPLARREINVRGCEARKRIEVH